MKQQKLSLKISTPEQEYFVLSSDEKRKKFGQFFTPEQIATFMVRWACGNRAVGSFLDPAVGTGIFLRTYQKCILSNTQSARSEIVGYEIDSDILSFMQRYVSMKGLFLRHKNYLEDQEAGKFDAIVCNPPYMKHHFVSNKVELARYLSKKLLWTFPPTLNSYCLFLIKSLAEMRDNGRCAYIVPSEFLNADYGVSVKSYLVHCGMLRAILYFDHTVSVFDSALTTAAILLFENRPPEKAKSSINLVWIKNEDALEVAFSILDHRDDRVDLSADRLKVRTVCPDQLDPHRKWQNYFTETTQQRKLHAGLIPLSTFGVCSRGIATGANDYFVLSEEELQQYSILPQETKPCIGKAAHVTRPVFGKQDFLELSRSGKKCHLIDFDEPLSEGARKYIDLGVSMGINKRFLPAHRRPWYSQEKRKIAYFWIPVFFRDSWRVIRNDARILNLTTYHGFYLNTLGHSYLKHIFAYLNSAACMTVMTEQIRRYGDGLNKFEPNDVTKILVPNFAAMEESRLRLIERAADAFISDGLAIPTKLFFD